MAFGKQGLGLDICGTLARRYIVNSNEPILTGLSNEMILNINVFRYFVKARIISKLTSSLVIHEVKLRIGMFVGLSEFM